MSTVDVASRRVLDEVGRSTAYARIPDLQELDTEEALALEGSGWEADLEHPQP